MSTNINITVGDNALLDAAKQQQAASRQAQLNREASARLETQATAARTATFAAQGRDANGNLLTGSQFTQPQIDRRPAANRADSDIVQIASATRVTEFTQAATADDPLKIDQAIVYNLKGQVYGKRVPSVAEFQGVQGYALVEIFGNPYFGTIIRDFRPDEIPPTYVGSGGPFDLPYIYGLRPNYILPEVVGLTVDSGSFPQGANVAIVLKRFEGFTIETYHKAFGDGVTEVSLGCSLLGLDPFDAFSINGQLVRAHNLEPPTYTESWTRDMAKIEAFSASGISYQENRLFGDNGSLRPPAGQWIHSCLVVEPSKASFYTNGILTLDLVFEIPIPQIQYTVDGWGSACSGMSSTEGLGPETSQPEVRLQIPYGWAVSRFTSRPRYKGNFTPGRIDTP